MEPKITYVTPQSEAARHNAASELRDYLFMAKLAKAKSRVDRVYKAGRVLSPCAVVARAYHGQSLAELAEVWA